MEVLVDLLILGVGAALVPGLVTMTLLLVRDGHGRGPAVAWVLGMLAVRVLQGVAFGWIVPSEPTVDTTGRPTVVATGMLVLSLLLFATAAWTMLTGQDSPSERPSRWVRRIADVGPGRAFLFGVLVIALGARQWVCTLGAIGAIGASPVGPVVGAGLYAGFTVLATSLPLAVVVLALVAPDRSAAFLTRSSAWLRVHESTLVIVLGLVFGTIFGLRALADFGVL